MITSASNQQIKNLTALMKKSKERKKQGVFVVEGPKMCFEAPNDWVKAVYVSESYISNPDNDKKIKESNCMYGVWVPKGTYFSSELESVGNKYLYIQY